MTVYSQARHENSEFCQFLNEHLPQVSAVTDEWGQRIAAGPEVQYVDGGDPVAIGRAIELRIGLDRTNSLAYERLLSCLSVEKGRFVLQASGLQVSEGIIDPEPVRQRWQRMDRPEVIDDSERAVLDVCYSLADMVNLLHGRATRAYGIEDHRRLYGWISDSQGPLSAPEMLINAWRLYLERGRKQIAMLGEPSQISPEIAKGFAVGDLLQGEMIVDIKAEKDPGKNIVRTLRQVLAYALLDYTDRFDIRSVGAYSAFQGLLVSDTLESIFAASTKGASPQLADLRSALHECLRDELVRAEQYSTTGVW